MRLNVKKTQAAKKRRFEAPSSVPSNLAQVGDLRLLHQKSDLAFYLDRPSFPAKAATWYATATTSLYVLQEAKKDEAANANQHSKQRRCAHSSRQK